jgi:hypothetical protein
MAWKFRVHKRRWQRKVFCRVAQPCILRQQYHASIKFRPCSGTWNIAVTSCDDKSDIPPVSDMNLPIAYAMFKQKHSHPVKHLISAPAYDFNNLKLPTCKRLVLQLTSNWCITLAIKKNKIYLHNTCINVHWISVLLYSVPISKVLI